MRQAVKLIIVMCAFGTVGGVIAEEEADAAIKAECMAQAEEQGAADVESFVVNCIKEKTAQGQ